MFGVVYMENIFELVITKLLEVGFYDLLIFLAALTLFYAILKKTKMFGDMRVVNELLAFSIAFLVFGFPVIVNYSLVLPMTKLFTSSFVFILVFLIGMLMASFFYPDLTKFLTEVMKSRSTLYVGVAIGVTVAVLSGIVSVLWAAPPVEEAVRPMVPWDTALVTGGVVVFVILLIVAGTIALRGGG
jgi:hypothetical protein